jgi:hypothetical protein
VRQDLDVFLGFAAPDWPEDLVALDEALDNLAAKDKRAADLVHLHFFAGLPLEAASRSSPLRNERSLLRAGLGDLSEPPTQRNNRP